MKHQNWFAIGSLLMLLTALAFACGCSGVSYREGCRRVSPTYDIWKCRN